MSRAMCFLVMMLMGIVFSSTSAFAQDAGHPAIEGYVFDGKTLKPLANAYVSFGYTLPGGIGGGITAYTDNNGFYQMEFDPLVQTPTSISFNALCRTKKADVQVDSRIYFSLRDSVYRRDFYITLPKNVTKCNL